MKKKQIVLLISIVIIFILAGAGLYYFYFHRNKLSSGTVLTSSNQNQETHSPCLADDEYADYDRISLNPAITQPKEMSPMIYVRNKTTREIITTFRLDDVLVSGHPMETHRCGIYVVRAFNYDSKKASQRIGYRDELWRYDYKGQKKMLLSLSEKPKEFIEYYSIEFRVNPAEKYLSLIHGYLGKSDYAIIIKDLNTLQDIFTLSIQEIEKRNPDLVQDISFNDWTKDGRYFWVHTHYGANTLGFIRIDTADWSVKIIPAPKDVLGGDALNLENGYITLHPGNVWYGITEITEQEKAKRRAQGIGTELYIQNLITGKRLFVDKTDEPLWYFKPQWFSDTQLEYELPTGEKKIYEIIAK